MGKLKELAGELLLILEEKEGGAPNQYEYDLRGNITRVTQGSKALESFTFDETNWLVKVVEDGKNI